MSATTTERQIVGYRIIDNKTHQQIGRTYAADSRRLATRRADQLDLAYGAYRYNVVPVWSS